MKTRVNRYRAHGFSGPVNSVTSASERTRNTISPAAFAHAADDDAPFGEPQQLDGTDEIIVQDILQGFEPANLLRN